MNYAMLHLYVVGLVVLVSAILLNILATRLKFMTWYDFAKRPSKVRRLDYVWLLFLYPMLLGIGAYLGIMVATILPLSFLAIY